MPLNADQRARIVAAGVHADVIPYLDVPERHITDDNSFANFLVRREEVQTLILDQITANAELKDDRGQRGLLIKLWREAAASASIRLERKAKGVGPDDLEDPLPEGDFAPDVTAFDRVVHWEPALSELLC